MNLIEMFFAVLAGALAMLMPALMLLRAARLYSGDDWQPPAAPAASVQVVEQHLHLHYHADGAIVRNGERPAALVACRQDAA